MSDPVTNLDIEDVLASIRRLVSDGGADRVAPQAAELPRDRLVLTPALRVAAQAPVHQPSAESPADRGQDQASRLAATIAELETALGVGRGDWEPDGSEDTPEINWATARADETPLFRLKAADVVVAGPAPAPPPVSEIAPLRPAFDAPANADVPPSFAAEEPLAFHTTRILPATPRVPQADPQDTGLLAEDLATDTSADWPETLAPDMAAYLQEDSLLDEETLRNLVIEIVRQELQGTLGERITRNVRKLVRREIHRVLSSQEFE